jgi:hypothetical protein
MQPITKPETIDRINDPKVTGRTAVAIIDKNANPTTASAAFAKAVIGVPFVGTP